MADKAAGKTVRDESVEALSAWREWKDVCAVNGCSEEAQRILVKEIRNGFRRKLNHFAEAFGNDGTHDFGEIDFSTEFDSALCEYEHSDKEGYEIYHKGHYGDKKHVRKAKCWKDFTWAAVAESPDPELKVIRGKLTGGVSVMNQIVEDFISRNCPGRFVSKKGKEIFIIDADYDKVFPGDQCETGNVGSRKKTFEDFEDGDNKGHAEKDKFAKEDSFAPFLDKDGNDIDLSRKHVLKMCEMFDSVECALLLAAAYGILIYKEEEILNELGVGKATAYNRMREIHTKIFKSSDIEGSDIKDQFVFSAKFRLQLLQCMISRLAIEKFAPSLLSRIDAIKRELES